MATIQKFEYIDAWQKARELTRTVYACGDKATVWGLPGSTYQGQGASESADRV